MNNSFTSPNTCQFMQVLKNDRTGKISNLINNLKISDVKTDSAFENSKKRIKDSVVLTPVVLGEPTTDYRYEEKPLTLTHQIAGIKPQNYTFTVVFPFTGSREIFNHVPEAGYSFTSSDRGLIIPYSNQITVYVNLHELNPALAIQEARNTLRMTFDFMEKNNASVAVWSGHVQQMIDTQMEQKRKQLIEVFGN